MRKILVMLVALVATSMAAIAATAQTVTLDVRNMTCSVCPITVKKSLQGVAGVSDVRIDYATKTAQVTFDPDQAKPGDLTAATTDAGYPSTARK